MPTKRFMLFQLILSGISQILIISPLEDVVSTKIAVIKNSDSILVLIPACGHGMDEWQQGVWGRAIAAAPTWPHPSLMSYMHTGLFIWNTEEVMSPSGTKRFGVSQALLNRVKQAEEGSLAWGSGINPAHCRSVSLGKMEKLMWVSWTHPWSVSRNVTAIPHFGLDLKICNSSAWNLLLETSRKHCGNCAGDGEAIVICSGQNQREKGGRAIPGSVGLALDRRKPSHVYEWSALSTENLWGHVCVVTCPAIPLHWVCSSPEWALLKRKDTSQLSTEVISVGEAPCTASVIETHFNNALVQKSWNKQCNCYPANAEGAGT